MKFSKLVRKTQPELKRYVVNALKGCKYKPIVQDGFVYAEGNIPVMLVAHLDTVHRTVPQALYYTMDNSRVMCPEGIGGDDRCGVYIIFKLIEKLTLNKRCHVLFCEDEEIGGIGANKFTTSGIFPDINYIIEFDRRGNNDAVFYDCDNEDFTKFITSFGFKEEYGSFSDISFIAPHLKVAAVNLSSGYYNAHSTNEYVSFTDMDSTINRAFNIINQETGRFEYVDAIDNISYPYSYYSYPYDKNKTSSVYESMKLMKYISPFFANVKINGEIASYDETDYYMDTNGIVYMYDYDLDVACQLNGAYAVDQDGICVSYADIDTAPEVLEFCNEEELRYFYGIEDDDQYADDSNFNVI